MNHDELIGKKDALEGKAKQVAGDLTDDPDLYEEGLDQEAKGHLRDATGHAKQKVGEAVEDLGKKLQK